MFYFVPNAKVRFRDVWVGAVLTGLLWRVALAGFSLYVRDLSRFSVHGSIAAVVVFLLWVYISAVILLYGVEVTAAYARLRRHRPEEIPAAPARACDARSCVPVLLARSRVRAAHRRDRALISVQEEIELGREAQQQVRRSCRECPIGR